MPSLFFADFWRVITISLLLTSTASQAQPLVIGAYQYPPFMNEETKGGLYIQLMKLIQTHSHLEFKWVFYPYARLDYLFNQGKVHLEVGSSPQWNMDKPTPGLFTDLFYRVEDVAVYRSAQYKHAISIEDFKGQSIGVVRGYYYPLFDHAFSQNIIKKVERANEDELLQLLINERINQAFINKQVFKYLLKHNPEYAQLKIGSTAGQYDIAIRVHPDHAELIPVLNQAIKELKANGSIQQLFEANL